MMMLYGPWVATIFFLIIGLIFTIVSSIFGVLNAFGSPIETIVGVYGLFAWNAIAGINYFLVICIWAGEFHAHLAENAPISQILRDGEDRHWSSKGKSQLGYSYWLVLVSFFCHLINVALVGYFIYNKYKPKRKVLKLGDTSAPGPDTVILY
jgi:hypothetical protein